MRRKSVAAILVAVPLVALTVWVSRHTYWADVQVPMLPKGEALTNPFYAAQRFAEALGARTAWDRVLTIPPADSVIVLSTWHWTLSTPRRLSLERWVESGGRLIVEGGLTGGDDEFARWSGITQVERPPDPSPAATPSTVQRDDFCNRYREERDGTPTGGADTAYWLCGADDALVLTSRRPAAWALRDANGIEAVRVAVGRGSVTMINAAPFRERELFFGDHDWIFVTATQLRRGDDVHFLSESDHPSLIALAWRYGAPFVVLVLAAIGLALWRGSVRFGPLAAAPPAARRSLAEQIRGTGRFALRHGAGESLHAASVRALDEAAQRRIPGYLRLANADRAVALAKLTGFERDAVAAAVHHTGWRRAHELRNTIALLEAVRRDALIKRTRTSHGTR